MSAIDAGSGAPGSASRPHQQYGAEAQRARDQFEAIWRAPTGIRRLTAVNNSVVGRRFIVTGFLFFLIGGVLALLMRTQLFMPENDFLTAETYNQLFTMHGTTMMFLFAVPIMEAFGVYLLPGMLGTRDLAFPRLSAYGYWCYLLGGILIFSSFLIGKAPDGGWFMYVPLTTKEFSPDINQDFWLLGVTFVEISSIGGAIELIVTILKARAPGMSLNRMPIFAWYMLAVSFMIVIGFPPLVLASILLEVERAFGIPFYDISRGGDALLWQHLFWIFGHPEVYIIFLPAAGIVSSMLPALARSRLVGYHLIVLAAVGTAFLSFGLWVHHMYATGIPRLALSFFAGASLAVAIPSGIQVFAWIATLWNGRPRVTTPLLFVIGFVIIFVLGGLTGVMVAMVPFDWQAHDTYFVVAHFHYVLIGGMVFPLFAALTFYLPRSTGRMLSESLGRLTFWLMFIGFNAAFLPMHWTGLLGMPRRVFTYPEEIGWTGLNMLTTVASYVFALGVLTFIVNAIWSVWRGADAGTNPWDADTLDWANKAPVPPYNVRSIPRIDSRHPLWDHEDLEQRIERGLEYLGTAPEGRREVLVTTVIGATPEYVSRLPHPTWVPLWTAIATAAIFIGMLVSEYMWSLAGVAALIVMAVIWLWQPVQSKRYKDAGLGLTLPIDLGDTRSSGWLGAVLFVLVDAAVFVSLVYAFFYLWTATAQWPPIGFALVFDSTAVIALGLTALLLPVAILVFFACRTGGAGLGVLGLLLIAALGTGIAVAQTAVLREWPVDVRTHAYAGIVGGLVLWQVLHAAATAIMALFAILRCLRNGLVPDHSLAPRVAALFAVLVGVSGLVVSGVVYGVG